MYAWWRRSIHSMTHQKHRAGLRALAGRLSLAACLALPSAARADTYFDYFFRHPATDYRGIAQAFKPVLNKVDAASYQKADALLNDLIAQAKAAKVDDTTRAKLSTDAGILKAAMNQDDQAKKLLAQSVSTIEDTNGGYSALLYNPLMVEGIIASRAGDYPAAVALFRRAQYVLHVQNGVYTRKQLPVVRKLADIDQNEGLWLAADVQERFDLRICERAYGANSEALIPTLEHVGKYFADRASKLPLFFVNTDAYEHWLKNKVPDRYIAAEDAGINTISFGANVRYYRTLLFDQSADLYHRAIKILEDKYGPNDLRLVDPLKGLSRTRLLQRTYTKQSQQAMERVVKIVQSNPSSDLEDRVNALVELADLYNITGDSRAWGRYMDAWKLMNRHPELAKLKTRMFGKPQLIFPAKTVVVLFDQPFGVPADTPLYATLRISLDAHGRPRDVKLVDGNVGADDRQDLVQTARRQLVYRPEIVDGKFVAATDVMFRQRYRTESAATSPKPKETDVATKGKS